MSGKKKVNLDLSKAYSLDARRSARSGPRGSSKRAASRPSSEASAAACSVQRFFFFFFGARRRVSLTDSDRRQARACSLTETSWATSARVPGAHALQHFVNKCQKCEWSRESYSQTFARANQARSPHPRATLAVPKPPSPGFVTCVCFKGECTRPTQASWTRTSACTRASSRSRRAERSSSPPALEASTTATRSRRVTARPRTAPTASRPTRSRTSYLSTPERDAHTVPLSTSRGSPHDGLSRAESAQALSAQRNAPLRIIVIYISRSPLGQARPTRGPRTRGKNHRPRT